MQFRKYIAPMLLIILIMSLFGCAPALTEVPETLSPVLVTATSTTPPTETLIPQTSIPETLTPVNTVTPFVPKATIKIAVHVPLTGKQAAFGTDILHAADLAVRQLALPLQDLGYKVEVMQYDDQGSIEVAEANANEIVADPQILCGVGHYDSKVTIQATEIYHNKSLAFISPSSTTTTVTDRGHLEVNRVVGRDDGQGIAGAQFAQAQGFKSVYTLGNSSLSSRKNVDYFQHEAERIGLNLVGMFMTDETDSEGSIRRVMDANPELVYFAGRADQAGRFFKKAREAGYMGAFLGTDGANSPNLLRIAGPSLIDGGGMYFTDMVAPAGYYPDATKFVQDFQAGYGAFPQLYAASAYDAAGICMKAIEEASKAKGGEIPTRAEVARAIRALKDYKGITGTFNFNKRGDPILAKYFVIKVVSTDPHNWEDNTVVATYEVGPP
jgi:branched-chain amino acid transport system substrate-binding protein